MTYIIVLYWNTRDPDKILAHFRAYKRGLRSWLEQILSSWLLFEPFEPFELR